MLLNQLPALLNEYYLPWQILCYFVGHMISLYILRLQSVGEGETVDMSAIKQEPPSNFGEDGCGTSMPDGRQSGGGKAQKLSR